MSRLLWGLMTEPITERRYAQCPLCWNLVWEEHFFYVTNTWIVARTGLETSLTGHRTCVCMECYITLSRTVPKALSGPDINGHVQTEPKPDCSGPNPNHAHP